MIDSIVQWLNSFLVWLKDLLLWFPKKLFELLMDGLASVIEAIPVPDFVYTAGDAFNSVTPNIVFFANKFAVPEGVAMVLSAYLLRFLIRRIPFIG